jgi:osmotically-inducible protein OsmY
LRKATHRSPEDPFPPNDVTLARKVESDLFRDPDVPKGRINVNAEGGIIVLRGELGRREQIEAVEAAVRRIPGVREVENLLHLPGTPARMS